MKNNVHNKIKAHFTIQNDPFNLLINNACRKYKNIKHIKKRQKAFVGYHNRFGMKCIIYFRVYFLSKETYVRASHFIMYYV